MKRRYLFSVRDVCTKILVLLAVLVATECTKEKSPAPCVLLESNEEIIADSYGSTHKVNFYSEYEWTVLISDKWIEVEPIQGSAGDNEITISALENGIENDNREGFVTIVSRDASGKLIIKQEYTKYVSIANKQIDVDYVGCVFGTEIKHNTDFSVEVTADWIARETDTKSVVADSIYFAVEENVTTSERTGEIIIKCANQNDTIVVRQDASPELIFERDSAYIDYLGGKVSFAFKSNVEIEVEVEDGNDWLSFSGITESWTKNYLVLEVEMNDYLSYREARIIISYSGQEYVLKVIQEPFELWQITGDSENVSSSRQDFSLSIVHSLNYELSIDVDWIDLVSHNTFFVNYYCCNQSDLQFAISENDTKDIRYGTISLVCPYDPKVVYKQIKVAQYSKNSEAMVISVVPKRLYNNEVALPFDSYECSVDWGDGTTSTHDSQETHGTSPTHKYSEKYMNDTIDVTIYGKVYSLSTKNIGLLASEIVAVKAWGNTSISSIKSAFAGCSNLVSIPDVTGPAFSRVWSDDITQVFYNCSSLKSVPGDFLSSINVKDIHVSSMFYGCSSMITVPEELFKDKSINKLMQIFAYSGITEIPNGLFAKCSIKSLEWAFANSNIESIPTGLFDNIKGVTNVNYLFYDCEKLSSVPKGLFKNFDKVEHFDETFYNCKNLKSIPEDLFSYSKKASSFSGVFRKSGLETIPRGLFDNNRTILLMQHAFEGCSNLSGESPYTIINNKKVHLYERKDYPDDFLYNDDIGWGCFREDYGLSDYNNIPYTWR